MFPGKMNYGRTFQTVSALLRRRCVQARAIPGTVDVEHFDCMLETAVQSDATDTGYVRRNARGTIDQPIRSKVERNTMRSNLSFTVIHDPIRRTQLP